MDERTNKGFQNPNLQERCKRLSEGGLNICQWGNGQLNYWPTHFMEFYTVIKGIGRDNYTNLQ